MSGVLCTKPTRTRILTAKRNRNSCHQTPPKKQPISAKKGSKPPRLRFKSSNDRKKFLRSIEEMEGVSFDDSSNDDDSNVVEQSLMQLCTNLPSESLDEHDSHLDLHVLVLQPGNVLEEADVVMEEVDALCPLMESSNSIAPPPPDHKRFK